MREKDTVQEESILYKTLNYLSEVVKDKSHVYHQNNLISIANHNQSSEKEDI